MNHQYTLSLQAVVSSETNGKDTFAGVPEGDSAETLVYAHYTIQDAGSLSAHIETWVGQW
jgi:hypothetical protein